MKGEAWDNVFFVAAGVGVLAAVVGALGMLGNAGDFVFNLGDTQDVQGAKETARLCEYTTGCDSVAAWGHVDALRGDVAARRAADLSHFWPLALLAFVGMAMFVFAAMFGSGGDR